MSEGTQGQTPPERAKPQPEVDPLGDLHERLAPQLEEAQAQLLQVNQRVTAFIKKNPGTALLGVATLGYLIGRWASRR